MRFVTISVGRGFQYSPLDDALKKRYITNLYNMIDRNYFKPFEFTVIADVDTPFHTLEPEQGMPTVWQKLSVFNPNRFQDGERICFLDLDVLVVGDLDSFLAVPDHSITMDGVKDEYNSSVMVFPAGSEQTTCLYDKFWEKPDFWIDTYTGPRRPRGGPRGGGDQRMIHENSTWNTPWVKEQHPWIQSDKVTAEAVLLFFHGHKKPHQVKNRMVAEHWR